MSASPPAVAFEVPISSETPPEPVLEQAPAPPPPTPAAVEPPQQVFPEETMAVTTADGKLVEALVSEPTEEGISTVEALLEPAPAPEPAPEEPPNDPEPGLVEEAPNEELTPAPAPAPEPIEETSEEDSQLEEPVVVSAEPVIEEEKTEPTPNPKLPFVDEKIENTPDPELPTLKEKAEATPALEPIVEERADIEEAEQALEPLVEGKPEDASPSPEEQPDDSEPPKEEEATPPPPVEERTKEPQVPEETSAAPEEPASPPAQKVVARKRDRVRAQAIPKFPIKMIAGAEIAKATVFLMKEKAKGLDIAPQLQALMKGGG